MYLHIPFCVKKCAYCDFLSAPADEEMRQRYVDALCLEIYGYRRERHHVYKAGDSARLQPRFSFEGTFHDAYEVDSIFLGGGTPSILEGRQIRQIFTALWEAFDISPQAEITIEANPGTVTREKLAAWREVGIGRVSIGLQSASDEELRILGRIHTYGQFEETYRAVREAGFDNVNVDLISAIPGQDVESWRRTLEKVAAFSPEHISAYSLIVEEGTPFYEYFKEAGTCISDAHEMVQPAGGDASVMPGGNADKAGGCAGFIMPALPSEEDEREMYHLTGRVLSSYGYHQYEISNYAKEGYACRHNLGYWERREYLGIGLGAASLIGHTRFKNTSDLETYLENMQNARTPLSAENADEVENLTPADEMAEFLFLGLRKTRGISTREFAENFGRDIGEVYEKPLRKLENGGWLKREGDRVLLTERGMDVSNMVFVEFLEPEV